MWHRWDKTVALVVLVVTMATPLLSETEVTWEEKLNALQVVLWEFIVTGLLTVFLIKYMKVFHPEYLSYHPDPFTTVYKCDVSKVQRAMTTKQICVQTDDRNFKQEINNLQNRHDREMSKLKKKFVQMKKIFVEQHKISCDILRSRQRILREEEQSLLPLRNQKSAMIEEHHKLEEELEVEVTRSEDLADRLDRLAACLKKPPCKMTARKTANSSMQIDDFIVTTDDVFRSCDHGDGDATETDISLGSPLHRCDARTHLLTGSQQTGSQLQTTGSSFDDSSSDSFSVSFG